MKDHTDQTVSSRATLKDRFIGDVYTRKYHHESVRLATEEAKRQAIVDIFFKKGIQPLAGVATKMFEDICIKAGTRDFNELNNNPNNGDQLLLIARILET